MTGRKRLDMPDKRPVIAHVLHRLDRAGAEVLAAGLARSLRTKFRFVFFCLDGLGPLTEELTREEFAVEYLKRQPGLDRHLGRRLRAASERLGVNLIHAHQYTPFFYSALSRVRPCRRRTTPILFTEHGRHYPDHRSLRHVLANRLLLTRRDRVTAVGAFVRQALVTNEGIADQRIDLVYNGIDPGPDPSPLHRERARKLLNLDPGRSVVMQVARFHSVKDHATAVRAFAIVRETLGETHDPLLVLVGDGEERSAIESLAKSLHVSDAVRFTGAVGNARELIPAADVCMLSSLSEGVSVTLLEAMAAGKPVVATDVGGNSEVVENQQTGLLSPRSDAQALADNLINVIFTPRLAGKLGQAGRKRLLERFTAQRMHEGYARIYDELTSHSQI